MVGVVHAARGDLDRVPQRQVLAVHKQPDQLRDGHCRVRVVQLERVLRLTHRRSAYVLGELLPGQALLLEVGEHVLDGGGDEEVLLLEAQLLPVVGAVVRVEDAADADRVLAVVQRRDVVALVEGGQVELLRLTLAARAHGEGVRLPQPQVDRRVRVVAVDRRVERHGHHLLRVAPLHLRSHARSIPTTVFP